MTMRPALDRSLVLAALVAASLTGCASGTGTASDHTGAGEPRFTQVALVSQTAAGGRVAEEPARLSTPAAVDRFTAGFRGHALADKVAVAVRRADVPAGRVLLGAVVAVGCDIPPGVRVEDSGTGVRIVALPVRSPHRECLAPVTTVALVSVPATGR